MSSAPIWLPLIRCHWAVGVLRRCAETIAVGIGGDEQIELFAAGERKETVVSHGKLGIWRGDRWENVRLA